MIFPLFKSQHCGLQPRTIERLYDGQLELGTRTFVARVILILIIYEGGEKKKLTFVIDTVNIPPLFTLPLVALELADPPFWSHARPIAHWPASCVDGSGRPVILHFVSRPDDTLFVLLPVPTTVFSFYFPSLPTWTLQRPNCTSLFENGKKNTETQILIQQKRWSSNINCRSTLSIDLFLLLGTSRYLWELKSTYWRFVFCLGLGYLTECTYNINLKFLFNIFNR